MKKMDRITEWTRLAFATLLATFPELNFPRLHTIPWILLSCQIPARAD